MRKREILLIEEDPGSLHDMQPVLASAGHTVRTASGVNEALDILTGFQPGFLVLAPESPSNCGMCLPDLLKLDPRTRNTVVLALAAPGEAIRNPEQYGAIIRTPVEPSAFLQLLEDPLIQEFLNVSGHTDLFSELRTEFIREGQASAGTMEPGDSETSDRLHRWAGLGGSLGLPEITARARELELLARSPGFDPKMGRWADGLSELNALFTRAGEYV